MPRYIDADLLIEAIKNELWDWDSLDGITSATVLKQTITDIQNTPTADVVEIRHGAWVESTESKFRPYMCSECGALFDVDTVMGELTWRFCPACGAEMEVK